MSMECLKKRSSHYPWMDILPTYIFKNHYITRGDVCSANTARSMHQTLQETVKQNTLFYYQSQCQWYSNPLFWSPGLETVIHLSFMFLSKIQLLKESRWKQSPRQLDCIHGLECQNPFSCCTQGLHNPCCWPSRFLFQYTPSKHACLP